MRAVRCAVVALLVALAVAPAATTAVPVNSKLHQVLRNFKAPVAPKRQANCTAYARQDNCVGNPPLRPDALPPCASFAGPLPANATAFGIIGDYGLDGQCMSQVAALTLKVQEQFGKLEFIMTLGDNAYWTGACESLQSGVGQYYSSFLPNGVVPSCTDPSLAHQPRDYVNPHLADMQRFEAHQAALAARQADVTGTDEVGVSSEQREHILNKLRPSAEKHAQDASVRFYPSMGNHDWTTYGSNPSAMPYFQFFSYLQNLEPAELAQGQFFQVLTPVPGVELFSLNSNLGNPSASPDDQALFAKMVSWLEGAVRASTAPFKLVHFHHPPFTTAQHDPLSPWMDLDYEAWGVSAVFAGHEHVYERMIVSRDGGNTTMPYIVNGLGGHPWTYAIDNCPVYPGSQFRYNAFHGMQLAIRSFDIALGKDKIDVCFYSLEDGGKMIDHFDIIANQTKSAQ